MINSTLGSSLPSNAVNYFGPYFHVTNDQQLVLPITLFLVGYVFGPLFFGPLSETYGRRVIMLSSFIVFTLFTMACALSPNWPAFLVFRLICGVNASSAIAVVGGLYADVFADPVARGRAMAVFMAVSTLQSTKVRTRRLTVRSGHNRRSSISTGNIRLRLRCIMALDFLDWSHFRWCLSRSPHLPSRNLRSHNTQTPRQEDA